MIDAVDPDVRTCLPEEPEPVYAHLPSMMMAISFGILRMHRTPENDAALSNRSGLAIRRPQLAPKIRCIRFHQRAALNLPGEAGRRVGFAGYAVARRIFCSTKRPSSAHNRSRVIFRVLGSVPSCSLFT